MSADRMRTILEYKPDVTEDVKEKARRAVAVNIPKSEVKTILEMLGIA